jgi:D-aspartate ligase
MKRNTPLGLIDTSTPVVVIKVAHHLSLGVARSLGRLGIPVYNVEGDSTAPPMQSRYWTGHFNWDADEHPYEATVDYLIKVAKELGQKALLFHTTDESAELVAAYGDILSEYFYFPRQRAELVRALTSKKEMYHLAKKHDVPTAETSFPQSREDVVRYLDSGALLPVMMKGIDGLMMERRTGYKMRIARTREEVLAIYDAAEDPAKPNVMLQEYIPGGDDSVWMLDGYFNDQSDCLIAITAKKIRQAPVYTGYTSLGICLENDTVRDTTIRFMKEIGYRGVLDLGYRYDKRDGQYKVLDINPRVGATFRLFVSPNGMDVVRAAYLDLTGQQVPDSRTDVGRKWLVEDRDFMSCLRYLRDKNLTAADWLKSFEGIQESAWYASDDPNPFLSMIGSHLLSFPKRIRQFLKGLPLAA